MSRTKTKQEVEELNEKSQHEKKLEIRVGLHLKEKKTEVMAFGHNLLIKIKIKIGKELKHVVNFKYLGGRMRSSEKDFEVRKALAWSACNNLKTI